jgi:TM2 domain-containing membrane protein YozV
MTSTASTTVVTAPAVKTVGLAYVLWFFLGAVGGHKFYLGNTKMGIIYLLTFGLFGLGIIYDLFTLPKQVEAVNAGTSA